MRMIIRNIAAVTLLLCAALPASAREPVASQPIAVQMYSLRNVPSLDAQLKIVHDAGVAAVETVGNQNTTAAELKRLLAKYGITPVSTHVQLADLRKDPDSIVAFNKAIGNKVLVVPYLSKEERPTDAAGWTALGKELGAMARQLQTKGMTLAYHNHDFELADFDGKTGLERLFDGAGPTLKSELDLAWVARANLDPAKMLDKLQGRVFAVHAKDNAPAGQNKDEDGFAAVGKGVLDWNTILPAARNAGVQWYVIEHDNPRDPATVIKSGADYLREHLPARAKR